jgi:hypothetical protein
MQKEKNGSMEGRRRSKDIVQNHSKPFRDVLASFEALVELINAA